MKTYNMNDIDGLRTWPEFEKRMPFYVTQDVVFVELENCSNEMEIGENVLGLRQQFLEVVAIHLADSWTDCPKGTANEEMKSLTQLANSEQELYEKDQYIQLLESELARLKVAKAYSFEDGI